MTDDTHALVLELLTAAATAHGVYEEQQLGGVYDQQWPEWYTAHIVDGLARRGLAIVEVDEHA